MIARMIMVGPGVPFFAPGWAESDVQGEAKALVAGGAPRPHGISTTHTTESSTNKQATPPPPSRSDSRPEFHRQHER